VFPPDARPYKLDDRDMVPRLASRAESMAEHKSEGSLQHCFISLLKACFLIKDEYLLGRGELLIGAGEKSFNLGPINGVRL
jgi:hypothetical protein